MLWIFWKKGRDEAAGSVRNSPKSYFVAPPDFSDFFLLFFRPGLDFQRYPSACGRERKEKWKQGFGKWLFFSFFLHVNEFRAG